MTKYTKNIFLIIIMFIGIILISIATGGCDLINSHPSNEVIEAPSGEIEAVSILRASLMLEFRVYIPAPAIKTIWLKGICIEGLGGIENNYNIDCITGLYTYNSVLEEPIMYVIYNKHISKSSYLHELVHRFRHLVYNGGDSEHNSTWFTYLETKVVHNLLIAKGL